METVTGLIGTVENISGDHYYRQFSTQDWSGNWLIGELNEDVPIDTLIVVDEAVVDGLHMVIKSYHVAEVPMAMTAPNRTKCLAFFRVIRTSQGSNSEVVAQAKEFAEERARRMQDWSRSLARDRQDFFAEGNVLVTDEHTMPPLYASRSVSAWEANNDYELLPAGATFYQVHGGFNPGFCGHALRYRSVNYGCTFRTAIHEMEHMNPLGNSQRGHNGKLQPNGSLNNYGGDSVMAKVLLMLSPYEIYRANCMEQGHVLEDPAPGAYKLVPAGIEAPGVADDEYQLIAIRVRPDDNDPIVENGSYYFGVSQHSGQWRNGQAKGYLQVHVDGLLQSGVRHYVSLDDLAGGESRNVAGYTITNKAATNKNEVNVSIAPVGQSAQPAEPFQFESLSIRDKVRDIAPADSGLYWHPHYDGQGWSIRIADNGRAVGSFYTGDNQGDNRWYIMDGMVVNGVIRFSEVYRTIKGSYQDPSTHEKVMVGKASVHVESRLHGDDETIEYLRLNLNTTDHGRETIAMHALTNQHQHPENGLWYDPSRDGEGVFIERMDRSDGHAITGLFYTYGPPPLHPIAGPNFEKTQRQFIIEGWDDDDGVYDCVIRSFDAVQWRDPADARKGIVGECRISLVNGQMHIEGGIDEYRGFEIGTLDMMLDKLF